MATPNLTVYDFDRVSCIMGPVILDGYADGDAITVEPDAPFFTKYVGADGKVTRAKTLNRCTKVTFRLAQSSAVNDQLSALLNGDLLAANGAGVVPFALIDRSGRTVIAAEHCWVSEAPSVSFTNDVGTREWVIECGRTELFIAGN
jgi:hypothetical protein